MTTEHECEACALAAIDKDVAVAELESGALRQAFDQIATAVGCSDWEYPGQVVRAVEELAQLRRQLNEARKAPATLELLVD